MRIEEWARIGLEIRRSHSERATADSRRRRRCNERMMGVLVALAAGCKQAG